MQQCCPNGPTRNPVRNGNHTTLGLSSVFHHTSERGIAEIQQTAEYRYGMPHPWVRLRSGLWVGLALGLQLELLMVCGVVPKKYWYRYWQYFSAAVLVLVSATHFAKVLVLVLAILWSQVLLTTLAVSNTNYTTVSILFSTFSWRTWLVVLWPGSDKIQSFVSLWAGKAGNDNNADVVSPQTC